MALKVPKSGLGEMLKEGLKHYQGLEEAVYRNIQACRELQQMTRTSMGPNGKNKMVINHLEKLFVTNDAATIIKELDVFHPAAKILVMASQQQEQEVGDHTNFVIVFGGELLDRAEGLLRMGLHPSEIMDGYEKARKLALTLLKEMVIDLTPDLHSKKYLEKAIRAAIASKQLGYENLLTGLVTEACLNVMPKNAKHFSVDNVRVVKILGGSVGESTLVKGMVFGREPESVVHRVEKAKVVIYSCPLEISKTETKGTVLIHNAEEMLNFSRDEERRMEEEFKLIAKSGVKVLVTGNNVSDMALHFINRLGLMVVKVLSKFELRRLCKATGATALARVGAPTPEEMGYVHVAEVIEIGSDRCTVFRQENEDSQMATIVIRGSSKNLVDDIERAIDDGVNVVKALTKDTKLIPGAGATEIELARRIMLFGQTTPGLEQYAIKKFAEALEVIPRTLAENAGMDATEILSKLYAVHQDNKKNMGVDIENESNGVCDATERNIFDLHYAKSWAIQFAVNAANTILSVDQIIMSRPSGGPKPKNNPNYDED